MNRGRIDSPTVRLGPGDDAAVLAAPDGRYVVSTDMLVEGRHFRLDWSSPHDIGRKAIAQNAADVAAMGARSTAFTVAIGCPSHTPVAVLDGLADGMWAEAERAGGSIAGGDLVAAPLLVLSVTACGDLAGRPPVRRDGASPGDIVAVAGRLGWSAAGLALLAAGRADHPDLIAAHRAPQPDYAAAVGVAATAMTDVSDGLLADLGHLAAASGVAVDLSGASLADPRLADVTGFDSLPWILTGGEDHAFVATFPPAAALPPSWRRIGAVRAGSGVTVDGAAYQGEPGWESFRSGGNPG